jgi:hypothetical protein
MPEDGHLISILKAREFAIFYANAYKGEMADVHISQDSRTMFVEPEPSAIFDISGDLLFYDFIIRSGGTGTAQIRIAANINLGHPFVSLQGGKERDTREMLRSALDRFRQDYPTYALSEALPVCFNYPRTGIMLWVTSPEGINSQLLFDPEFPDRGLRPIPEGAAATEGDRVHSVLGEIPEGGASPNLYFDLATRTIKESTRPIEATAAPSQSDAVIRRNFFAKLSLPPDADKHDTILDVPYVAQDSSDFCVLACLEMLNKFLLPGRQLSQRDIHGILVQDPPLYGPGGVLPEKQIFAFQRVFSDDQFGVDFKPNPSWEQATQSIAANLPFKSGISGHARVCVGFNAKEVGDRTAGTAVAQKAIYVNDPSGPSPRLELYQVDKLMANGSVESSRLAIPIKMNAVVVRKRAVVVGER